MTGERTFPNLEARLDWIQALAEHTPGAHVADATDAASAIARLNDLIARLEVLGLLKTS